MMRRLASTTLNLPEIGLTRMRRNWTNRDAQQAIESSPSVSQGGQARAQNLRHFVSRAQDMTLNLSKLQSDSIVLNHSQLQSLIAVNARRCRLGLGFTCGSDCLPLKGLGLLIKGLRTLNCRNLRPQQAWVKL